MRLGISVTAALVLGGCVATTTTNIAGTGETTKGLPVSGNYIQSIDPSGIKKLDLTFVSADGLRCISSTSLTAGQAPWTFPTTCSDGTTGRVSLTPDYATARDTVIYTLSNGERGSILFGGSTAVQTPNILPATSQPSNPGLEAAGYALGCAISGGYCSPQDQQTVRVETDFTCRETISGVRCRSR